jgi:cob(I)alamin adenosyltransferase
MFRPDSNRKESGSMTRIYTRTGDFGETGLFGGGRVGKDEPRVDAYGEVDELNAALGLARSEELPADLDALAQAIQEQLFTLGAILATPAGTKAEQAIPSLQAEWIVDMEKAIDRFDQELSPLRQFILPGGNRAAASLHLARTICRRAERRVVPLFRAKELDATPLTYLNRLSDLLFTMARVANQRAGIKDVGWKAPER